MIKDKSKLNWVELIRVSFKSNNGKVGDANMEGMGPTMMIVGDMNSLQLNDSERTHGIQCPLSFQQVSVWIYMTCTLLTTSVLIYPALVRYILESSSNVFVMLTGITFFFLSFLLCTFVTVYYGWIVTLSVPTDPIVIKQRFFD